MLTFFTTAKPFTGHNGVIQKNAIKSWTLLKPKCEIIILGDEAGSAETAEEFGAIHIPGVEMNEFGTPKLDSLAGPAIQVACNELVAYINADIILVQSFMDAVRRAKRLGNFIMVGRRWNADISNPIDFSKPGWESEIAGFARREGKLFNEWAIDYFVTKKRFWEDVPPFYLGRGAWDNYLLYKARKMGFALIDATPVTTVIHQNHDYGHISQIKGELWRKTTEAEYNRKLSGGPQYHFTLFDATRIMGRRFISPPLTIRYIRRRLEALAILRPELKPIIRIVNVMLSLFGLSKSG